MDRSRWNDLWKLFGPGGPPRRPKASQEVPQGVPKASQGVPETFQGVPEASQGDSRWAQRLPKAFPKGLPRCFLGLPRIFLKY